MPVSVRTRFATRIVCSKSCVSSGSSAPSVAGSSGTPSAPGRRSAARRRSSSRAPRRRGRGASPRRRGGGCRGASRARARAAPARSASQFDDRLDDVFVRARRRSPPRGCRSRPSPRRRRRQRAQRLDELGRAFAERSAARARRPARCGGSGRRGAGMTPTPADRVRRIAAESRAQLRHDSGSRHGGSPESPPAIATNAQAEIEHRPPARGSAADVRLQQHREQHPRHDRADLLDAQVDQPGGRPVRPEDRRRGGRGCRC